MTRPGEEPRTGEAIVEMEIPARPEFVGIVRMAVGALAGIRPGLSYERLDELRMVVSDACANAIEELAIEGPERAGHLQVRCIDGPQRLEVRIVAPAPAFERSLPNGAGAPYAHNLRISLIRALVDEVELRATELRLIMRREAAQDDL